MVDTNRMRVNAADVVTVARAIARRVQTTEVTFLAAAVAYYAFLSLLPALLLLLSVASMVGGDALAELIVTAAGELLTPAGQEVVRNAFRNAAGRSGATVIGVIVLLWSALKVFRGLDVAFLKVYGATEPTTLVDQLRDGATAIVGVGTGLAVMLGLGTLLAAKEFRFIIDVLGFFLLPALLAVVFLPLYYVFPDVDVSVAEVVPGAVFAAVGWTALQAGFQIYAGSASQYQTYGVLGGVLLLVTWFYLAAIVLLVGGVVNVVLAGRHSPGSGTEPPIGGPPGLGAMPSERSETTSTDGSGDRQVQHAPGRQHTTTPMAREDRRGGTNAAETSDGTEPAGAPDITELQQEVDRLRSKLEEFESDVESRTVDKPELESELKRYVRKRMRRGHARGWGPYLVLLYGTALTLGAFYWLDGLYAIAAMVILGLSTLGLYVLFIMVGIGLNAAGIPFRALDRFRGRGK